MRSAGYVLIISILLLSEKANLFAGEPKQAPPEEPIPAPIQVLPLIVLPEMPRPDTREVWRYYGVDSFGRFRPRVILSPYGSYYLHNLEPYPWINNQSTRFMPYVRD